MGWFTKLRDTLTGKRFLDAIMPEQQDLGAQYDKQLAQQRENAMLEASNEARNVAQFDGEDPALSVGTDQRRKKRSASGYAAGMGLQV
jgi:hypothetical protein